MSSIEQGENYEGANYTNEFEGFELNSNKRRRCE